MDLDLPRLLRRYFLPPRGVIHAGAHAGQERLSYTACGLHRQVWIEPEPEIFERLRAAVPESAEVRLFNIACGSRNGPATLHRMGGNDGHSSSLLPPTLHLERWPDIRPAGTVEVPMMRLDDLLERAGLRAQDYSLLVVDVQGFELEVLRGAPRTLAEVDAVACEVSSVPLYEGGSTAHALDEHLEPRGFRRVITRWSAGCAGDALYIRGSRLGTYERVRLALLGGRRAQPPRSWRSFGAAEPATAGGGTRT